jgi:hypothetical protein
MFKNLIFDNKRFKLITTIVIKSLQKLMCHVSVRRLSIHKNIIGFLDGPKLSKTKIIRMGAIRRNLHPRP